MLRQFYPLLGWPNLRLVSSPPLKDTVYEGPHGRLHSTSFNPAWMVELGFTAPRIIVEVGSYDGGDALRLSRAFPRARVVAIEADPHRCDAVRANLAGSGIKIVEAAACDRNGPVDWFPATINGLVDGQGSMYRQTERLNRKFPFVKQAEASTVIEGRRLDEIAASLRIDEIDLLTMDVQGAEHLALLGLGEMRPKVIYLETMRVNGWIGSGGKKSATSLLRKLGYRLAADIRTDRLYVL